LEASERFLLAGVSGCFLDEPRNPDEDNGTKDSDQDAPDEAASAKPKEADYPTSNDPADDSQHDVSNYAISAALHYFSGGPTSNQTYDDPPDNPLNHVSLLAF
jgi:hypothetical protein